MTTNHDIDYDHAKNGHGESGPLSALPLMLEGHLPGSLLDVGCGLGAWTKAALALGIKDVLGIDGVDINPENLWFPAELFRRHDLSLPLDFGRTFDVALCLEVAEHLDKSAAPSLIQTLTRHAPLIFFSAAVPGQSGQHHVNCQWPAYWQALFNRNGFVCEDRLRWVLWDDRDIEPWYRQNLFIARRDPSMAGREPRIAAILHPDMPPIGLPITTPDQLEAIRVAHLIQLESGAMPLSWYAKAIATSLGQKLARRMRKIR